MISGIKGRFAVVLAFAGASVLLTLAGCTKKPAPAASAAPAPVSVAIVRAMDIPIEYSNIGSIQSVASVALQPQVDGVVAQSLVQPGAAVKLGQPLFVLDKRPYMAAVALAQAALAGAKANVLVAAAKLSGYRAALTDAAADWARAQKLGHDGGALSVTQYDAYRSTFDQATANVANGDASLEAAQRAVQAAKANLKAASINLDYCIIKAPFNGVAGNLLAYPGTAVKANTTTLLVINQIQPVYVAFSLPQDDLPAVLAAYRRGAKPAVKVALHGSPPVRARGVLSFVNNAVDATTGTIELMGTLANKREVLWPGEFCDATVQVGIDHNAIVVPLSAVESGQPGHYVFVVRDDNAVVQVVQEAFLYHGLAVISKGLSPGEVVITNGQVNVVPGGPVVIVKHGLIGPIETTRTSGGAPQTTTTASAPATRSKDKPCICPVSLFVAPLQQHC
ncbi:MAG: efflux RND transporter periplasmic adaptor subunit [Phycisphaerales bacterium]|nr:efflux RND transporter periplasmic adaptor subunit [Phycisphaerales bacterium]